MTTRTKEFDYDGRTLNVTATFDSGEWRVRVLENGNPANQIVYSVSGLTEFDARMSLGVDCVSSLIEIAEKDFVVWSDWLKREQEGARREIGSE